MPDEQPECEHVREACAKADEFQRRTGIPVWWKDYYDAHECADAHRQEATQPR